MVPLLRRCCVRMWGGGVNSGLHMAAMIGRGCQSAARLADLGLEQSNEKVVHAVCSCCALCLKTMTHGEHCRRQARVYCIFTAIDG